MAQIATAVLLFMRHPAAPWIAGLGAGASAFVAFFSLAATPGWSTAIIAMDLLVLWTVFTHFDEFE